MNTHRLVYKDPVGLNPIVIDDFIRLDYARSTNRVGAVEIDLLPGYPPELFMRDGRWEIQRSVDGGPFQLQLETFWLTRTYRRSMTPVKTWTTNVVAHDLIDLLNRPIVAYTRETPYADKIIEAEIDGSDFPDNLIKAYVRENMGSLTLNMFTGVTPDPNRDLSALITIDPDTGSALPMSAEKQASMRKLLAILQELADLSTENGVPLYFDMIGNIAGDITFSTFVDYRGIDKTASATVNPVIFSPDMNNLKDPEITMDYTEEATVVYVGGEGTGAERNIMLIVDTNRARLSPFGRIEEFVDGRDWCDQSVLQLEGETALRRMTPRRKLEAEALDLPDQRYGLHYNYGDLVTVQADNATFHCHISAVKVEVEGGFERRTVRLEGVEVDSSQAQLLPLLVSSYGVGCLGIEIPVE